MKILITGHKGYIGTHLWEWFGKNHQLYGIDINSECPADIARTELDCDPDWIIHLAAVSRISKCLEEPRRAFDTNVVGTQNVLKLAARTKAGVIFASTCCAYDDEGIATPYHETKLMGENLADYFRRHMGVNVTTLRIFNVYGHRHWPKPNLVTDIFLQRKRQGLPLQIYGGGECRRDYLHLEDLTDAVQQCMRYRPNRTLDVASGEVVSVSELAAWFHCPVEHLPGRYYDSATRGPANLDATREALDWRPKRGRLRQFVQAEV